MILERTYVIDYGGQYTHLIARRCRELGVYAEIVPQEVIFTKGMLVNVKGLILSGGPRTVSESDMSTPFKKNMNVLTKLRIPVLGICFGHQLLAIACGATLESGGNPEYGHTLITRVSDDSMLSGFDKEHNVWMSHSDQVTELPDTMTALAVSGDQRVAAFKSNDGLVYGVQFHPEVTHTPNGMTVLNAFLRDVCRYEETWRSEDQIDDIVERIKEEVGEGRVLMGTSGGVDSTVAAYLIRKAIGDRFFCVFVDNGLLREGEAEEVSVAFDEMGFKNFEAVDASDEFIDGLKDVEDPEEKRRIIAETFIRVFERKAHELTDKHGQFDFLGQGTIYPDRVESAATGIGTAMIKSHHNVRLPDWMQLKLVEPLKDLYKDEVRRVGHKIGIPKHMIWRQPFPGPSFAIRIGGPVTREQLTILREADLILQKGLIEANAYSELWQSFCVLLPIQSVGVMGDERTYEQTCVIRMVDSSDAMTASVSQPDWEVLLRIASRIANQVAGINRVVYDLTSKPPGTIEWY